MAPTEFVLDADSSYTPEELPPVPIRVDGTVYQAHCPKDSLPVLLSRLNNVDPEADPDLPAHLVRQVLLSVFDEDDAEELLERVLDMADRKVSLAYIIHVVRLVGEHYQPAMDEHYEDMGLVNPLSASQEETEAEPANRAQRRQLERAKPPAKKAAPRKTAAPRKATTTRRAASR